MSREESLQAAHQHLIEAVAALVTAEDWRKALEFAARFHHYSFANTLLIYCQHAERYAAGDVPEPQPSRVAGFHQWKGLGRTVDKGQCGYRILAPVTTTARVAHLPDGTQRRLGRNEPAPSHAQVEHRRQFSGRVTTAHVFDISQTSGEPVPEPPRPRLLSGQAPPGMFDGLTRQAHAYGFAVRDVPDATKIGGANGRTDFTDRTIAIRADMPELARCKTLAHELGHLLLHSPDSSDADWTRDSHTHRGRAEVEAESVAFMVLTAHGIASDDYTFPYVATWAAAENGDAPEEVIRDTGERVRRAAHTILDALASQHEGADQRTAMRHGISLSAKAGKTHPVHEAERAPSNGAPCLGN